MAQAVVGMACAKLRSAIDGARDEATGHLEKMLVALKAIQPLVEDAENRLVRFVYSKEYEDRCVETDRTRPTVYEWLRRVTTSAYDVSDMVDELHDARRTSPGAGTMMKRVLLRVVNVPKNNPMIHNMVELEERLSKLHADSVEFHLTPSVSCPNLEKIIDVSLPEVDETKVLGRDKDIQRIMAAISSSHTNPIIVQIAGRMKGSGITALGRVVFNHTRFKHYSRVWTHHGSLESRLRELVTSISPHVPGQVEMNNGTDSDDGMEYVRKHLRELLNNSTLKVLLVLDNSDLTFGYNYLNSMLEVDANQGNKVIVIEIMSRKEYKPVYCQELNAEECWTIIKQRCGFEDRPECDKQKLEPIGKEIAAKCGGLPLAAATLGGVLLYKDTTGWETTMASSFWREDYDICIKLAYASMPPRLKLCCAYFAIFPLGHSISKRDLIHQWIALGLVEQSDGFDAIQVGDHHVRMLIGMSLLETTKPVPLTLGSDDNSAILLTMRRMALKLLKAVLGQKDLFNPRCDKYFFSSTDCRYASITNFDEHPSNLSGILRSQLRMLHCVDCGKLELGDASFSAATCLRVLELKEYSSMRKLPDSICQLKYLGYLNLSGCSGLENLEESFGDLLGLLHLNLSGCSQLNNLPGSFGKLINLVHVDISGCSKLEKLPESLSMLIKLVYIDLSGCCRLLNLPKLLKKLTNLVYIDLSGCSRLEKLPPSFGKLRNLEHINLSGCSGLVNLPRSFGKLVKVPGINLSGCSRLVNLPESFGELLSLEHIDLSGCFGLVTLPESFGDLIHLVHINLSRCYGLAKLPQSFSKLVKLQHLDLSFWSCSEVIKNALDSRSNLQYLNLSHPCCSLAQHRLGLKGLKDVMPQLTSLQHLNLSMFFNPTSHPQTEEKIDLLKEEEEIDLLKEEEEIMHGYIECIRGLSSLEHLDLSHNMFLRDIPECLVELHKLHTLDLSGCIRLKSIAKGIGEMKSLKSLIVRNCRSLKSYHLVVQADGDSSNLVQLEDADFEELEISCLENVKLREEAQRIGLIEKQKLKKLKLCWTVGSKGSVLEDLAPPDTLQCLQLHGFNGETCFVTRWRTANSPNLLNLAEVIMEDMPRCNKLPPLGYLPNLQQVVLRRMASIIKIDTCDLVFTNERESHRLSRLTIDDMASLQQFNTTHKDYNGAEHMFTLTDELVIQKCPKLRFQPRPPIARRLVISSCDDVMTGWCPTTGGEPSAEGVVEVAELVVENCMVPLSNWRLLSQLPGLHSLTVKKCSDLTSSQEIIRALSSLQTLCLSHCNDMESASYFLSHLTSLPELHIVSCRISDFDPESMRQLTSLRSLHFSDDQLLREPPEWLKHLTSLQMLAIDGCSRIYYLPRCLDELINIKDLYISDCRLFEMEDKRKMLTDQYPHIRVKYEKFDTGDQGKQPLQNGTEPQPSTQHSSAGSIQMQQPSQIQPSKSSNRPNLQGQSDASIIAMSPPPPHHQMQATSQPSWPTPTWQVDPQLYVALLPPHHHATSQPSWKLVAPWNSVTQAFAVPLPQQNQGAAQSSSQTTPFPTSATQPQAFTASLQDNNQAVTQPSQKIEARAQHGGDPRAIAANPPLSEQHQVQVMSQPSSQTAPPQSDPNVMAASSPQQPQAPSQQSWQTAPRQSARRVSWYAVEL